MTRIELEIPEGVDVSVDHLDVTVSGPEGEVTRRLWYPDVTVSLEGEQVLIESDTENAKTNATIGTFESHLENAFHGVTEGWEYTMEVVYSHFPMQVKVEGEDVVIENFLGERAARKTTIHGDTQVQVDGDDIVLTGPNKEHVGQTAADIEQLTRINDKDTRVFQDGVYITQKPTMEAV
jgi:large subunit ribosomal protein L6